RVDANPTPQHKVRQRPCTRDAEAPCRRARWPEPSRHTFGEAGGSARVAAHRNDERDGKRADPLPPLRRVARRALRRLDFCEQRLDPSANAPLLLGRRPQTNDQSIAARRTLVTALSARGRRQRERRAQANDRDPCWALRRIESVRRGPWHQNTFT